MNRRAKRNKYKLTVRSLQNEISEYKKVFDHQRKFGNEKKVGGIMLAVLMYLFLP